MKSLSRGVIYCAIRNLLSNIQSASNSCGSAVERSSAKDNIIKSPFENVNIPKVSMNELIWDKVEHWPNKIAVECVETRKSYTYHQLLTNSRRFATFLLQKLRLDKGDIVSLVLPNIPEFAVAALGCTQAGCTVSAMNPSYTEYEYHHMLSITRPKVIITNQENNKAIKNALEKLKYTPHIIIIDRDQPTPKGTLKFSEISENGDINETLIKRREHTMDDLTFLPFSSGTTGLPKAVQISQKNILATMQMVDFEEICLAEPAFGTFQDVVPCVLPFFHIYGLIILLTHLRRGCKLLTMTKFNADLYLDTLKKDKASLLYVVPPMVIFLGKADIVTKEHLSSVRYLLSGAAPLSLEDVEVLLKKAPNTEVFQAYGATETTSIITTMIKGSVKDHRGVGFPSPSTELRLVCPTSGKVLSCDQEGELQVRGPQVTPGYYKNQEANDSSFTEDGFFRTGDLAKYSTTIGVQIKDRLKELIKVKGMQVAPAELEGILRTHPAVVEAAVVASAHEVYGEVPIAFVVVKDTKNRPKEEELIEFVSEKVSAYKRIHRLQYVKELPKTNTGKLLRRQLVEG